MIEELFTLYWYDPDGNQHRELAAVDARRAVERAASLSRGPAAQLGMVRRIIIVDAGDQTVLLWTFTSGIEFPLENAGWR